MAKTVPIIQKARLIIWGELFMTVTTQKITFEEFLAYDDGTDRLYELENGILIATPAESEINALSWNG